jgi:protein tyrosine phosphatase (PTP) superfamily phosphohydrolase (DUF442 family)
MIEFRSVPGVLVAGFCLLGTAGLASASGVEDIVNYREYSAILSSSGQPTQAQLQAVADAGYERVVFLAFSDHDESLVNEDRLVKELGMEYAHIPVDWDAPRNSDFHMFAGLMARDPGKKTLVHCQVNFRASTFSLLYRVLYQDVPLDVAKEDLNSVWVPRPLSRLRFVFVGIRLADLDSSEEQPAYQFLRNDAYAP